MTLRRLSALAILPSLLLTVGLGGCAGGGAAKTTGPALSPRETVSTFLQAAADSNLARMANLWGTSRGPAAQTRTPADWEKRIFIMQAYLRGTTHRIVAEDHGSSADQRILQVQLRRDGCEYMVPFTATRSNLGWVVSNFDLHGAGVPGRPCTDRAQEPAQ